MPDERSKLALLNHQVKIDWHVPDNIESKYATNMVIQNSPNEFTVSFFEIQPPIILGPPEAVLKAVEGMDRVKAKCVARIIIAPDRMKEFINVLQTNLETYLASKQLREEPDNGGTSKSN
jgi:hypothetical protein